MSYFNIVSQTNENTVVTEYEFVTKRSDAYQSEAELEKEFIRLLTEQGYEYLHIHTEAELIANLRKKLEEVNGYTYRKVAQKTLIHARKSYKKQLTFKVLHGKIGEPHRMGLSWCALHPPSERVYKYRSR